jgi:hypothetical protein
MGMAKPSAVATGLLLASIGCVEAYHGILGPGCPPNWFAGPNYPAEPCFHCPLGRYSTFTGKQADGTYGGLPKCTGVCADYMGTLDNCAENGFPSDGSCVCGCPGSYSLTEQGGALGTSSCTLCPAVRPPHKC